MKEIVQWTEIYRVCGEISVSRSLGDVDFKFGDLYRKQQQQQQQQRKKQEEQQKEEEGEQREEEELSPYTSQPYYSAGGFTSDYPFWFPEGHNEKFYNDLISGQAEFLHLQLKP